MSQEEMKTMRTMQIKKEDRDRLLNDPEMPYVSDVVFDRTENVLRHMFAHIPNLTQPMISSFPGYLHLSWALHDNSFLMLSVYEDCVMMNNGNDDHDVPVDITSETFLNNMRVLPFDVFPCLE